VRQRSASRWPPVPADRSSGHPGVGAERRGTRDLRTHQPGPCVVPGIQRPPAVRRRPHLPSLLRHPTLTHSSSNAQCADLSPARSTNVAASANPMASSRLRRACGVVRPGICSRRCGLGRQGGGRRTGGFAVGSAPAGRRWPRWPACAGSGYGPWLRVDRTDGTWRAARVGSVRSRNGGQIQLSPAANIAWSRCQRHGDVTCPPLAGRGSRSDHVTGREVST
jgi:hypothetical protein